MPTVFVVLWIASICMLTIRCGFKFNGDDFEGGMSYIAIIGLIIVATFGK